MIRKPFLDNLRYGIVLSVAVYHVFYQFNSVGVITNVLIPGIPALDAPLYVLYPWFMAALFMISGICARYSLEKQTGKQYLKGKVRRQLIPSIAIIFLIGWSTGWVTDQYANIFGGGQVPGFAKYLVWCMSGIGVLWFLHELLLCEVVLVLIRKLDKKDRLWQLGGKANFPVICLLVLGMWGSAYILNTRGLHSVLPRTDPVPARQMGTLYACRERRAGRRLHGAFLGTELRGSQQSESPAYQSLCVVCLPWGAGRGKTVAG